MKKNYSYIVWTLILILFLFTLKKTSEVNQAWNETYLAKIAEEKFFRSRVSKDREEEIDRKSVV